MKSPVKYSQTLNIILLTLFGFAGSILIGLIFYGQQIFIPNLSKFQFVAFGIIGSILFGLQKHGSLKDQMLGLILIFILNLVIFSGKSISLSLVIRDILYLGSLFFAVRIYYRFISLNFKIPYYLRSLSLAFFYSILTILFGTLVYLINAELRFPPIGFLFAIGKNAALIGIGIGIGMDFYLQNNSKLLKLLNIEPAD
jgi:hypothetical protein